MARDTLRVAHHSLMVNEEFRERSVSSCEVSNGASDLH
jgi:hypothetical protein